MRYSLRTPFVCVYLIYILCVVSYLYKHTGFEALHISHRFDCGLLLNVQIEQLHSIGIGFNGLENNRLNVIVSISTPNLLNISLIFICMEYIHNKISS